MADTTATNPPSWGSTLLGLLNKGVDTAAAYGAAKLQADAQEKAAKNAATVRSDTAASQTAAAGSKTSAAPAALPAWVKPVAIVGGVVVGLLVLWKIFARK